MSQYTKDELWKIFEALPVELKQAVFGEETADSIREICQRNNITGDQVGLVAGIVGDCLMGLLHPEDMAQTLVDDIGIDAGTAHNLSREINRLILFPVKSYLYEFYKDITFVPSGKVVEGKIASGAFQPQRQVQPSQTQTAGAGQKQAKTFTQKQKRADTYRESFE